MKIKRSLILLSLVIIIIGCQNRKSSETLSADDKSATYKVGEICKIKNGVFTASTDSDYLKIQIYIQDGMYNDDLEKLRKEGIYIRLLYDSLNEYYKIVEVYDTYVKVRYTNIFGKECNIRVNKKDIEHYKNPNNILPINYPIKISKSKVDSLYKITQVEPYGKIIGDFQLGMSKKTYNKLFDKYVEDGTIYQFGADGTMAYSLEFKSKYNDFSFAVILFPTFNNDRLKSLKCEFWNIEGGDGLYGVEQIFKNKFGENYYRNGDNFYWLNAGTKIALKVESCRQGSTYDNANTAVAYFE